jgi:hypothetical protein
MLAQLTSGRRNPLCLLGFELFSRKQLVQPLKPKAISKMAHDKCLKRLFGRRHIICGKQMESLRGRLTIIGQKPLRS